MRRFKLLGLALMAVFIAAVAVVGTASAALPKVLPEAAKNWTGASDGGGIVLLGSADITCTEAPATGTLEANKPLGTFHIEFKNCTTEEKAIKCTGLGDAASVILTLGTWHSVFDNLTTLSAAVLFLIEPVHFNCSALVLVQVTGELLCLWLEPTIKKATHLFHCVATSPTVQEDERYFNEAGTEVKGVNLKCAVNEGTPAACTELALGTQTFAVEVMMDI